MALTPAQLQTLKTGILAETDATFVALRNANNEDGMAAWLNDATSPAWYAWRINTPTTEIAAVVNWANYTPTDPPDGTTIYTNRCHLCALKRDNMRTMLEREFLPTHRTVVRQNLTDALQKVPAGVGGADLDAGWLGTDRVKDTIARVISRVERMFANGTGTAGQPGNLGWEGTVTAQNISDALRA